MTSYLQEKLKSWYFLFNFVKEMDGRERKPWYNNFINSK